MILKKYKKSKRGIIHTRVVYKKTGIYCLGCKYCSNNLAYPCQIKENGDLPKICINDINRWKCGKSNFVYHVC